METLLQIGITALTTLLSIAVLFLLEKMMGSKQVSQMTMFDYAIGITIGSIAAELATELEEPARPLTALIVYGVAAVAISVLTSKSLKARAMVTGKPLVLLKDGVIYRDNLKKARLDLSEFLTYCRIGGLVRPEPAAVGGAGAQRRGQLSAEGKGPPRHPRGPGPESQAVPGADALCHGRQAALGQRAPGGEGGVLGSPEPAAPGLSE